MTAEGKLPEPTVEMLGLVGLYAASSTMLYSASEGSTRDRKRASILTAAIPAKLHSVAVEQLVNRYSVAVDAGDVAKFLDAVKCAARYGFSTAHWRRIVDAGKAPQPTRFGHLCRWSIRVLDEWDAAGCPPIRQVKGGRR